MDDEELKILAKKNELEDKLRAIDLEIEHSQDNITGLRVLRLKTSGELEKAEKELSEYKPQEPTKTIELTDEEMEYLQRVLILTRRELEDREDVFVAEYMDKARQLNACILSKVVFSRIGIRIEDGVETEYAKQLERELDNFK
jgi:hypothetical protein